MVRLAGLGDQLDQLAQVSKILAWPIWETGLTSLNQTLVDFVMTVGGSE